MTRTAARAFLCGLLLALAGPSRAAPAGGAGDFFARAARAPLVAVARVGETRRIDESRLVVYGFEITDLLAGQAPDPGAHIVQEMMFRSDAPLFAKGNVALLLLEPFPRHSRYVSALPSGACFRVVAGPGGVRDAAGAPLVREYLGAPAGTGGRAARLEILARSLARDDLGDDSLAALVGQSDLGAALPARALHDLGTAIANAAIPVSRRRGVLDLVAMDRIEALLPAVQRATADRALGPFARACLAALGHDVAGDEIVADFESDSADVRGAAVDATRALPAEKRIALLSEKARRDPDFGVRVRAIRALGHNGEAALPALAGLLDDDDRRICHYTAESLADLGTDDAVAALAGRFEKEGYDAQVAAVFALRRLATPAALRALARVKANPPDERLLKVIDLASGLSVGH